MSEGETDFTSLTFVCFCVSAPESSGSSPGLSEVTQSLLCMCACVSVFYYELICWQCAGVALQQQNLPTQTHTHTHTLSSLPIVKSLCWAFVLSKSWPSNQNRHWAVTDSDECPPTPISSVSTSRACWEHLDKYAGTSLIQTLRKQTKTNWTVLYT